MKTTSFVLALAAAIMSYAAADPLSELQAGLAEDIANLNVAQNERAVTTSSDMDIDDEESMFTAENFTLDDLDELSDAAEIENELEVEDDSYDPDSISDMAVEAEDIDMDADVDGDMDIESPDDLEDIVDITRRNAKYRGYGKRAGKRVGKASYRAPVKKAVVKKAPVKKAPVKKVAVPVKSAYGKSARTYGKRAHGKGLYRRSSSKHVGWSPNYYFGKYKGKATPYNKKATPVKSARNFAKKPITKAPVKKMAPKKPVAKKAPVKAVPIKRKAVHSSKGYSKGKW